MEMVQNYFNIPSISESTNFWMVRTKRGFFFDEFINHEFIAIGWNSITSDMIRPSLSKQQIDDLKESIKEDYGENKPGTALNKCIRFCHEIKNGDITIDGQSIKSYTLKSLRDNIGIVQQDVYLFSGTVYENIAYGKPGATEEEIIEAAKKAGADEFITQLKDGYHTYVGERGVKLSGGQKQRISIARVFLKNPPIIILDEATSALDNESEIVVARSLARLSEGRTTLTIAHRLSTIRNADRILVLTDEGIVEEGNHNALMDKKGIYYNLYNISNELSI